MAVTIIRILTTAVFVSLRSQTASHNRYYYNTAMASLGLVSPGAATDGCYPIFS